MTIRNSNTPEEIASRLAQKFELELACKIGKCTIEHAALITTLKKMVRKGIDEADITSALDYYFGPNWDDEYKIRIDCANHILTKFGKLHGHALELKAKQEKNKVPDADDYWS